MRQSGAVRFVGLALLVAVGATVGTLVRASIELVFPHAPGEWPWATFAINILGSLALGALIGVGLIGAFAAREVFVTTMGVVHGVGDDVDEESPTLRDRIRAEERADGTPLYTPLVGMSLMVFFALAMQCMSTLAVLRKETGGWRWAGFVFAYMTVLAWSTSFLVYQGGRLLGLE